MLLRRVVRCDGVVLCRGGVWIDTHTRHQRDSNCPPAPRPRSPLPASTPRRWALSSASGASQSSHRPARTFFSARASTWRCVPDILCHRDEFGDLTYELITMPENRHPPEDDDSLAVRLAVGVLQPLEQKPLLALSPASNSVPNMVTETTERRGTARASSEDTPWAGRRSHGRHRPPRKGAARPMTPLASRDRERPSSVTPPEHLSMSPA